MTVEERMKKIVSVIEDTDLSTKDKYELYAFIRESFKSVTFPVLINHTPKDKLMRMSEHLEEATLENYAQLFKEAVENEEAQAEIERLMHGILRCVEESLVESGYTSYSTSSTM